MPVLERRLYLASRSPRRRELLKQIGVSYEVLLLREDPARGADLDETPLPGELPADYAIRIARMKAQSGSLQAEQRRLPLGAVLAADTVVTVDDAIIGKPVGQEHAVEILKRLSGREHQVYSAVALCHRNRIEVLLSATSVNFRELGDAEIRHYVATGEPLDKAGAYAIQGRAAAFIRSIAGSYSGVMGLPLFETAQLLRKFGYESP